MKSTKIKLNSRHLKAGDKIIRTKALRPTNGSYTANYGTVLDKNKYHIKLLPGYRDATPTTLSIEEWNDGNWVRYTFNETTP